MKNVSELKDYALARLKEHQESLAPSCLRDFSDRLLMEMEKVPSPAPGAAESWCSEMAGGGEASDLYDNLHCWCPGCPRWVHSDAFGFTHMHWLWCGHTRCSHTASLPGCLPHHTTVPCGFLIFI